MKTETVKGYYGSGNTPCLVYVAHKYSGGSWYCVDGSKNVNFTHDDIGLGVDVETLNDSDCFTAGGPIESEEDLIEAIEA
jgi:hypothetical protein